MKKCTICRKTKDKSEFNKRSSAKDGLQNNCRQCSNVVSQRHYDVNKSSYFKRRKKSRKDKRSFINEIKKSAKCKLCSEDETCCLDFHHRDPKEKDFELGIAANLGRSKERILKEIAKCVVVCANCHRKIHAGLVDCPTV